MKKKEKKNDYVNRVIPKEEKKSNEILLNNLDTNLIASKYFKQDSSCYFLVFL